MLEADNVLHEHVATMDCWVLALSHDSEDHVEGLKKSQP
jgi:hypothetical protein